MRAFANTIISLTQLTLIFVMFIVTLRFCANFSGFGDILIFLLSHAGAVGFGILTVTLTHEFAGGWVVFPITLEDLISEDVSTKISEVKIKNADEKARLLKIIKEPAKLEKIYDKLDDKFSSQAHTNERDRALDNVKDSAVFRLGQAALASKLSKKEISNAEFGIQFAVLQQANNLHREVEIMKRRTIGFGALNLEEIATLKAHYPEVEARIQRNPLERLTVNEEYRLIVTTWQNETGEKFIKPSVETRPEIYNAAINAQDDLDIIEITEQNVIETLTKVAMEKAEVEKEKRKLAFETSILN
jgi:hypothetical protein